MIELKGNEKLYFIANDGCDDSTHGLAIMSEEVFAEFKRVIKDLNKNSTYGCMPTIKVYRISPEGVKEGDPELADDNLLYIGDIPYVSADGYMYSLIEKGERVV